VNPEVNSETTQYNQHTRINAINRRAIRDACYSMRRRTRQIVVNTTCSPTLRRRSSHLSNSNQISNRPNSMCRSIITCHAIEGKPSSWKYYSPKSARRSHFQTSSLSHPNQRTLGSVPERQDADTRSCSSWSTMRPAAPVVNAGSENQTCVGAQTSKVPPASTSDQI